MEMWSPRRPHSSRWRVRRSGAPSMLAVTVWNGIPVTSPERTCADLARLGTLADGVVAADWFLSAEYCPDGDEAVRAMRREVYWAGLEELSHRPGAGRARAALAVATGLAESPAESLALYCLHLWGVTEVRQQVSLVDDEGLVGRVDFLLRTRRGEPVVAEVDGALKYRTAVAGVPGGDRGNPLFREKQREDRIRRLGFGVVRLTWRDLIQPERAGMLLREAGVL